MRLLNWFRQRKQQELAICCGHPLSEWFVWKHSDGRWGMYCRFCKRVSKCQEYREHALGGEP